jgi:hypothetical protein
LIFVFLIYFLILSTLGGIRKCIGLMTLCYRILKKNERSGLKRPISKVKSKTLTFFFNNKNEKGKGFRLVHELLNLGEKKLWFIFVQQGGLLP